MDTELPRVVYDRYEVQEADHPDVKDHLWFEVPGDCATQGEALGALQARSLERPGYHLRIVKIVHTVIAQCPPDRSVYDDEPDSCPQDRNDLPAFSTKLE